ncbi:MAG: hypothetical protein PHP75_07255 [Methylacidiphilaceae bacterium]|nr:hypothetical protein [Candidatus Methylacidiphilaceae bacterium]
MIHTMMTWIGRGLFWIMVSWIFPIELMSCGRLGERYASNRRALFSLILLLTLALGTALRQSWREALPVFLFSGLTGVAYALHRIRARTREPQEIPPNPWSLGIPPWPFRNSPRFFWLVVQPSLALALGLASLPISRTLCLYFLLAAPLLWIFRRLSDPLLPLQAQPPRSVPSAASQPDSEERAKLLSPFPHWPRKEPKLPQPASGLGPAAPPLEERSRSKTAPRSHFRAVDILLLLAAAGTGLVAGVLGLRYGLGSPDSQSSELFPSCVRTEQERLATLIQSGWRLPLLGAEKEAAWSEETLRSLSQQNDSALLPAMIRSWTGDTVYLVSGDFLPRAAVAVRFPIPGVVVEWTPWPPHRTNTVVYLYVQTRPEAAAELQRTLEGLRQIPPFHFERQSRLVPFEITRAGKQIILHCVSPRSFAFRIGDFELFQELSESGKPRAKNARKPNAAERASQPNPLRKAVRPGT